MRERRAAVDERSAPKRALRHSRGEARASHTPLDDLILDHSEVLAESGWDALQRSEEQQWVRQAMTALPEDFQLVLSLRYWSEMPLERIAGFLGLPLSTIKWRLHRARALMRDQLIAARAEPTETSMTKPHDTRTEGHSHRAAAPGAHAR